MLGFKSDLEKVLEGIVVVVKMVHPSVFVRKNIHPRMTREDAGAGT